MRLLTDNVILREMEAEMGDHKNQSFGDLLRGRDTMYQRPCTILLYLLQKLCKYTVPRR